MLEDWGNYIVCALLTCASLLVIIEWYGGKELCVWLKDNLEDWWLRLSYIGLPDLAQAEASFALHFFGRYLGKNKSWLRLFHSLGFAALFSLIALVWTTFFLGVSYNDFYAAAVAHRGDLIGYFGMLAFFVYASL